MTGATRVWLRGVIAALISGAAGGVPTTFVASALDPEAFNFGVQLSKTLALMGYAALIAGILGCAAYLKQSPLPPADGGTP